MRRPWVYFDTSAFLKLYIKEDGSSKARGLARKSRILSSAILPVESFSALSGKWRSRALSRALLQKLIQRIRGDLLSVEIVRLRDEVLTRAEEVVLNSPARTLDAIHIASALIFEEMLGVSISFATSDRIQEHAAGDMGLKTLFIGG